MLSSACNFIISAFPDSLEKQEDILIKIGKIKSVGGIVTLITHYNCPEVIQNEVDFYLFSSENRVSYKDSDVLNPDLIGKTKNFSSINWVKTHDGGSTIYRDYKGWIGYTPSIVSLLIPALSIAFSQKIPFTVYMESDFIFPDRFSEKINDLCTEIELSNSDSMFFSVPDSSWVHGHLFLLKNTDKVFSSIPWGNYHTKEMFLDRFPNFIFEDFLCEIASKIDPVYKSRDDINSFFGGAVGKFWDTSKFQWDKNDYMLYTTSICSPFVNLDNQHDVRIFTHLKSESPFEEATFDIKVLCAENVVRDSISITLSSGNWSWKNLNIYDIPGGKITFEFSITSKSVEVYDRYELNVSDVRHLMKFRNFSIE